MRLSYRCRRCGKVFYSGDDNLPRPDIIELIHDTIINRQAETPAAPTGASMEVLHECSEYAIGVGDLIGAS